MKIEQIKEVMLKYGKAWKNKDTSLILECFTPTGGLSGEPVEKALQGT